MALKLLEWRQFLLINNFSILIAVRQDQQEDSRKLNGGALLNWFSFSAEMYFVDTLREIMLIWASAIIPKWKWISRIVFIGLKSNQSQEMNTYGL